MIKRILFFHRYSIDVSFSAISLLLVLTHYFEISIPFVHYGLLFFSVLLVYNLDHYLDQKRVLTITTETYEESHQKLKGKRYLIAAVLAGIGIFFFLLLYKLIYSSNNHLEIFYFGMGGMIIFTITLIYLLSIYLFRYQLFWIKEFLVSILFTLGVIYPLIFNTISFNTISLDSHFLLAIFFKLVDYKTSLLFLVLLVFHNALITSYGNQKKDLIKANPSIWLYLKLKPKKNFERKIITTVGLIGIIFIFTLKDFEKSFVLYFFLLFLMQQLIFNRLSRLSDLTSQTTENKNKKNEEIKKKMLFLLDSLYLIGVIFFLTIRLMI